jgi:cytochrome c556
MTTTERAAALADLITTHADTDMGHDATAAAAIWHAARGLKAMATSYPDACEALLVRMAESLDLIEIEVSA